MKGESRSVCVQLFVTQRLYSPWNSPSQYTGVGSFSLLQGIFPTQGLNPGLLHCRRVLYQLSHQGSPRKAIALTIQTFVSKMMPLLCNTLSRFVIFPARKRSSSNFMATVTSHSDFRAQENKVSHCFHCFPIYLP